MSITIGEKIITINYFNITDKTSFQIYFLELSNTLPNNISEAHNKFVDIHPFIEGNGRTGRLIMNLILLQNGYVPIIIRQGEIKLNYENAIELWTNNKKNDFYNLIADLEKKEMESRLEDVKLKKIINKNPHYI